MSKQASFVKHERDLLPTFRNQLNQAENIDDVRNIFSQIGQELLARALPESLTVEPTDVVLVFDGDPAFALSDRLSSQSEFAPSWEDSDLPQILGRLAGSAANSYKHLRKHLERTEAKLRY